jgi:hypothetical protein
MGGRTRGGIQPQSKTGKLSLVFAKNKRENIN